MSYRNDVDALAARKDALDAEVAQRTRERDETARILDDARTRARLPVLDNIRVASPCSAKWDDMTGDERARLCAQCDKQVFNLSAMTRVDAEALIVEKNGKLCITYFQRKDGTILLGDCEIGKRGVRRRRFIAAGVVAAIAGGGATAYAMQEDDGERTLGVGSKHDDLERVAGGVEPIPYIDHDEPPIRHAPAAECYAFRERIFAVDDCISAEMRAHFRGVFVDMLAQSQVDDDAQRKQAVDTCISGAESLRGLDELCKK